MLAAAGRRDLFAPWIFREKEVIRGVPVCSYVPYFSSCDKRKNGRFLRPCERCSAATSDQQCRQGKSGLSAALEGWKKATQLDVTKHATVLCFAVSFCYCAGFLKKEFHASDNGKFSLYLTDCATMHRQRIQHAQPLHHPSSQRGERFVNAESDTKFCFKERFCIVLIADFLLGKKFVIETSCRSSKSFALIDCSVARVIYCLFDWLIDCLFDWFFDWLIDWLIGFFWPEFELCELLFLSADVGAKIICGDCSFHAIYL